MSARGSHFAAALRDHWPEYVMEACELGLFMISACVFAVLLFHPLLGVERVIPSLFVRRTLMGAAMGLTAVAIIYSPIGQRSGAHMNPAVTMTFWRLGRVATPDAVLYVLAQIAGGIGGVLIAKIVLGRYVADTAVNHAVTVPRDYGQLVAWIAEFTIACMLIVTVLIVSNTRRLNRYTGLFAGGLVALFITFEEPLSGMSINPARTIGSAFWAQVWTGMWIYLTAPPLAMLAGAALYQRATGARRVFCAKYHHQNDHRCIFRCEFHRLEAPVVKPNAEEVNPNSSEVRVQSDVLNNFG